MFILLPSSYNRSQQCHPREAEKRDEDVYEKIPRFELEDEYGKTEAGKSLVSNFYLFLDQISHLIDILLVCSNLPS